MRIAHIADLHIGKKVNEFSMIEDQTFILNQILDVIDKKDVEVLCISGDVYDKSIPPIEAIDVLNTFLSELYKRHIHVCMISGNHDSADRLNFGTQIFESSNIHIAAKFSGSMDKVTLEDVYGKIHVYMLPFIKPTLVNHLYESDTKSYDESIRLVVDSTQVDVKERNILLAHQFVTANKKGPELSDSEVTSLGGIDNVDASAFDVFDYVALGHIHKPQAMGRQSVRYSGSILKYSFSEIKIDKSMTILEMKEKGQIAIETIPLTPLHDMKELRCTIQEIVSKSVVKDYPTDTYMHVILTDEEEIMDAIGKVRSVYPNVMQISFDNARTKKLHESMNINQNEIANKSKEELFAQFFLNQNSVELTSTQQELVRKGFQEVEE